VQDVENLRAGDRHGLQQILHYCGVLTDAQIVDRVMRVLEEAGIEPPLRSSDAAYAVARHAAWSGLPIRRMVVILTRLAVELPGSPCESDEIAAIARNAYAELAE
jgi:hypothetical protein